MSWRSQLYPPSILDWGGVRHPMSEQELEVCLRSPCIAQEKCSFKCSLDLFIVIAWLKLIPDSMMVLDADLLGVLIISLPETLGGKIERRFLSIAHRYLTDEYLTKLWQSQPSWCQKGFMELESKCVSQEVQQISTHYTVPFTTLDPAFLLSIVLPCILDSSEWCIIKHWWNWFG